MPEADQKLSYPGHVIRIAAVMGAYLIWFPRAPVKTIIFLIIPLFVTIQAMWLLIVWFVLQFFTAPESGVAWVAHVAGFVFGVAVAMLVRASSSARRVVWRGGYR